MLEACRRDGRPPGVQSRSIPGTPRSAPLSNRRRHHQRRDRIDWRCRGMAVRREHGRIVLMHMQGTPRTMNVAPFTRTSPSTCTIPGSADRRLSPRHRSLASSSIRASASANAASRTWSAAPLALPRPRHPILLGVSRKARRRPGIAAPDQRVPSSLAAAMHALSASVQYLRVRRGPTADRRPVATPLEMGTFLIKFWKR